MDSHDQSLGEHLLDESEDEVTRLNTILDEVQAEANSFDNDWVKGGECVGRILNILAKRSTSVELTKQPKPQ